MHPVQETIEFPIFCFEGNDLSLFSSIEEMVTKLEGIDVAEGVYEIFDSKAHEVHLSTAGVEKSAFFVSVGKVAFQSIEPEPNQTKFNARASSFLAATGVESCTQEDLAATCITH